VQARKLSNFALPQPGFNQWATDFELPAGLPARAIVANIIEVVSVNNDTEAALESQRL
jgi:hypothetical protein